MKQWRINTFKGRKVSRYKSFRKIGRRRSYGGSNSKTSG